MCDLPRFASSESRMLCARALALAHMRTKKKGGGKRKHRIRNQTFKDGDPLYA